METELIRNYLDEIDSLEVMDKLENIQNGY